MNASRLQIHKVHSARTGVTLTEVLMSLMIMGIGLTSVAVLFPISVLRSIQATQLTNSAMLKYNAETLLQMRSHMVFDPDGDGNFNEHVSRRIENRYIVDPVGYYQMTDLGMSFLTNPASPADPAATRGFADWFGNVDSDSNTSTPPVGFVGLPRFDGGLRFETRSTARPQGFNPNGNTAPEQARALQMLASTISKLGDGWTTILDTFAEGMILGNATTSATPPPAASVVGVVLSGDVDLSDVPDGVSNVPRVAGSQLIADPELYRVVVFSVDGKFSVSFPITRIDNATKRVLWTEDMNLNGTLNAGEDLNLNGSADARSLPPEFIDRTIAPPAFQIGRVVIQANRTHDFNWLLTVRRGSDGQVSGVDVVVTFSKGVTPDDERVYSAAFPTTDATVSAIARPFLVDVLQDGGLFQNGDTAEPLLKRGGYFLDLASARWYRISEFQSRTVTVGSSTGAGYRITLESPVIEGAATSKAMFLPGIVDIFPMGPMQLPNNL